MVIIRCCGINISMRRTEKVPLSCFIHKNNMSEMEAPKPGSWWNNDANELIQVVGEDNLLIDAPPTRSTSNTGMVQEPTR